MSTLYYSSILKQKCFGRNRRRYISRKKDYNTLCNIQTLNKFRYEEQQSKLLLTVKFSPSREQPCKNVRFHYTLLSPNQRQLLGSRRALLLSPGPTFVITVVTVGSGSGSGPTLLGMGESEALPEENDSNSSADMELLRVLHTLNKI